MTNSPPGGMFLIPSTVAEKNEAMNMLETKEPNKDETASGMCSLYMFTVWLNPRRFQLVERTVWSEESELAVQNDRIRGEKICTKEQEKR